MDRLKEMLKDEKSAPSQYYKLIKQIPVKDRPKIKSIIRDERRHFKILNKIMRREQ